MPKQTLPPVQFQVIPGKDFSRGEDQRSSPSALQPGFCESLLNVNTNSRGQLSTRKGYQGYFGWVPLRAFKVEHAGTEIKLKFDSSQAIDLSTTPIGPLVVYGRLSSAQSGDFSATDALQYYPHFSLSSRLALTAPSGTLTLSAADHGLSSSNIFVGFGIAADSASRSWTQAIPDSVDIDTGTYDISVGYDVATNDTGFLWYLDGAASSGTTYVESVSAVTSKTITAAAHLLNNFNILVKCFDTSVAGTSTEVIPDAVTVDSAGEVIVSFTLAFTGDIVLTSVIDDQKLSTSAAAGTNTLTITDVTSPWVFAAIYAFNSGTSKYEQVIPESVAYSEADETLTITYTLVTGTELVDVYYTYGSAVTNSIAVTDNGAVSTNYSDSSPQITVWGISHEGIYTDSATYGGHVQHIDVYRRSGEERVICGLGGNQYAARTRSEVGDTYGLPKFYANLRSRVDGDVYLAPLFQAAGSSVSRTRGVVTDSTISSNLARVTAATYVSAGVVDYTLTFAGKTGNVAIGSTLATTDSLTVSGLAWDGFNGAFPILSVQSDSSTQTVIRCTNSAAFVSNFDETGADGRAGVFTDNFAVETSPAYLDGDQILSSAVSSALTVEVDSVSAMTVTVSGVTSAISMPDGVLVFAERSSTVIPLRTAAATASTDDLVRGDMLTISGLTRKPRVLYVNPSADNTITDISGDGTAVTVTATAAHYLNVGQKVLLAGTGVAAHNGVKTITSVPSTTTFTFASTTTTAAATGRVVGETAELDEELTVRDGNLDATSFEVEGRWIPIEYPTTTDDLPDTTVVRHLDVNGYSDQPRVRSVNIAEGMILTNGDDEVLKFDGDNLYRAGLFRWQPQLFSLIDETTGSITFNTITVPFTANSNAKYTVGLGASSLLPLGTRVLDDSGTEYMTVIGVSSDGTNDFIYTDVTQGSGTGNLVVVASRRYYFRLRAIDANQNVVASAATGADDCVVELGAACQVKLRMVGMPAFQGYDYDRIELDVFSTKTNTSAPFYLNQTVAVSFDSSVRYIDVVDTKPDETLSDLDTVSTALLGQEIGTAWDQPLRAAHLTTLDNALVQTNLKGYPELDLVLRRSVGASAVTATNLDGKKFLFRRDHTDISTTSNLTDRQAYEFVKTATATITPATDIVNNAGASFTVTKTAHGLVAGDWVYLAGVSSYKSLTYAGWWQLNAATTDDFTILYEHDSSYVPSADDVTQLVRATAGVNIPVWLDGTDQNFSWLGADLASTDSWEFEAMRRLAAAINVSMRVGDTTGFTPWMTANAGSEFRAGELKIVQPVVEATTLEALLPTLSAGSTFEIFANDILRDSAEEVSSRTLLFPSRVAISYKNYPEIFDNPSGSASFSDSVVDVNASDGQEATVSIPFFGASSFGTGQSETKLIVFKTASIYQLDPTTRQYQKIEQPYGGCTAPSSVAQANGGIMFANESGVYRLNKDMSVSWVGENEDRRWKEEVSLDDIAEATGHNYLNGGQYKLSVPVGQSSNNKVLVMNYTAPDKEPWMLHDSHAATGWANKGNKDSLFGTTNGQVYKVRAANDRTDYRDDASAISVEIVTKAEDFDLPGVRKTVSGVHVEFHNNQEAVSGVTVATAADTDTVFAACDPLDVAASTKNVVSAWFSPAKRKLERVQTKITCASLDSPITVAGVSYRAAALGIGGTKQAAQLE